MSNTLSTPTTAFDPTKPHCSAEARFVSEDGKDGGGHMQCLQELNADGSCPNALVHHEAWIASGLGQDEWAATVIAARSPLPPSDVSILQSSNMTANVQTRTGSRYTVVTRPEVGVVLIHDTKGWAVRAGKGSRVAIIQGRMYVIGANGRVVAQTTSLTGVYIMSN